MTLKGIFIILTTLFIISCKTSTKLAAPTTVNKKAIKAVEKNWDAMSLMQFPYHWVSYRSRLNIDAPTLKIQVKLTSHLIKDSLLWASVSKLGFESHRMLLTPDTIKILDRLGNQYIIGSTQKWLENQGLLLTFNDIQNLWIGNYPRYPKQAIDPHIINPNYQIVWEEEGLDFAYLYSILENSLIKVLITDPKDQTFSVNQSSFNPHEGFAVPYERTYEVSGDEEMYTFKMSIQDVKMNQPKALSFQVPERYERVDL